MTNCEMELYGETGMQQLRDELMHLQELTAKNEKNNVERLQAEIVALKHDIERHVELNAKLTTKNEELQKTLKAVQENSGINFRMWQEAQVEVERLQAQLPKRGVWKRVEDGESYHYECTQCGERPLYTAYGHIVLSGTCPNCGAKMEVQE